MTALKKLYSAVIALNNEVTGLDGYADSELQDLIDFIGVLNSHIPAIEREACSREMAQSGLID